MNGLLGKFSLLGSLTIISRFLGLARDVLFFSVFGASLWGEAFILAFTLPNLFRRMLGEGTLSSAFIPIYAETWKSKSINAAFSLLNKVISRLSFFLLLLVLVVSVVTWFLSDLVSSLEWRHAIDLNAISFGYVGLICCAAILTGALNTHGKFFAGGFSPIILNLCMISALGIWGLGEKVSLDQMAEMMCWTILIAGLLQLLLPLAQLKVNYPWKFKFTLLSSDELSRIKQIFWIGALGAAVAQINILVSRLLAYSLNDEGSLSYLFISSRLIELPLGVFAISVSTVLFPELSKSISNKNRDQFREQTFLGIRLTAAITIPAAAGLSILSLPILSVLFNWGMFGQQQVVGASEVLLIAALGLPFYAVAAFLVKVFHSEQNMSVPLKAAIVSLITNLGLSLLLMDSFGVFGLAWANVLAALFQTAFLWIKSKDLKALDLFRSRSTHLPGILISTIAMIVVLFGIESMITRDAKKLNDILVIGVSIPLGVVTYATGLLITGMPEMRKFLSRFALKKT